MNKVLNIEKKTLYSVVIGVICAVVYSFNSCTTSDDILKKYEKYQEVPQLQNRIGIHLQKDFHDTRYTEKFGFTAMYYLNPAETENYEEAIGNMKDILNSRFIVLDAERPTRQIEYVEFRGDGKTGSLYIDKKSDFESLPKFIIVGFKGIRKSESEKLETPALFVLFEVNKKEFGMKVLTPTPLFAEDLFPTDFLDAQFVEAKMKKKTVYTEYIDEGKLGEGKTLSLSLVLATKEDEKRIEKCEIKITQNDYLGDGKSHVKSESKYGYGINISSSGKFSEIISDYLISGTVAKDGIKGTITMNGKKYSYSATKNKKYIPEIFE